MTDVLKALINASERAACIARSCLYTGNKRETLLVAEKCEGEANTRFEKDFKTIADVLAQESAKALIAKYCPDIADNVRGEECAEINGVRIELRENEEKTAKVLSSLVAPAMAVRMANAAHREINLSFCETLPVDLPPLNPSDLGVWIDPIDGTAEFIAGVRGEAKSGHGLPCVTVLIGAYLRSTGEPVIGVINQPFFNEGKGRLLWGVSYDDTHEWGGSNITADYSDNTVLMSGAERSDIAEKFKNAGWVVKSVPGAGHKLLKVVLGEAATYVVSHGTTYRWDTCAPHAILRAKGGDLLNYTNHSSVTYNDPINVDTQQYCNSGGIIAYRDKEVLNKIKSVLGV